MAVKTSKQSKKDTVKKVLKQQPAQAAPDMQQRNLQKWNLRFAFLLVAEAVAIVAVGGGQTVPVTTQYLAIDPLATEAAGHQVLAAATRHLFDVPLALVVAKFLVIFALAYLLAGTLWCGKYQAWLARGVNKLRWAALGLGGGVMAVAVAMLSGVSDLVYLWLIFGAVVLAGVCALSLELLGPGRRLRRLLATGAVLGALLPWLVFIGNAVAAALYGGTLPNFLYYIYISMFLLSSAGVLAGYLRIKQRGRWADTLYTERMFMALNFVAASVLALQIFAGALQP